MKDGIIILAAFLFPGISAISKNIDIPDYADPYKVGILVSENLLSRDYMLRADKTGIHYAEVCTAEGAIRFADLVGDALLARRLEKRYACFLDTEICPLIAPSDGQRYMVAHVVFALYLHKRQQKYLDAALRLVSGKWNSRGDPHSKEDMFRDARFWSDDMYSSASLDSRIYTVTGDPDCIDRPANWLVEYNQRLQLPNGLYRHTTNVPFIWGRGVGWSAVGLTNILLSMPLDHLRRDELMKSYLKLMSGLIPYQSGNGLWRQLIDYPESYEETSGSAMFAYAMATGIRMGWLDRDTYLPLLEKAWIALVERLDNTGALRDVCIGTNEKLTAEGYMERRTETGDFHGQAPILWTAIALIELERLEDSSPHAPNTLTRREQENGWKLLWDGSSTHGWRAIYLEHFPESGWIIEKDQLVCLGEELPDEQRGGAIVTSKKYGSFELSFEFKIQEGANSGIKYFIDERLKARMGHGLGLEYAILDDENFPYPEKDAKRTCGSLYDLVKAEPGATLPVGEWNRGRIVVEGNHIEHWLNGKRVVQVEKGTPHYHDLVSNSKYRNIEGWGEFPEGHILIQDEGPRTAFRNLKIRPLDSSTK